MRNQGAGDAGAGPTGDRWADAVQAFRDGKRLGEASWEAMFGPLRRGRVDDLMVVGQSGQSIDGRVATASGDSKYVNGAAGLQHLHRLRSLVDAVVIGVGTAVADDPRLTVRRVSGPSPARVVIDPNGRLPATRRVLAGDGVRRLIVCGQGVDVGTVPEVECIALAVRDGDIAPADIIAALAQRGFRRLLIEGGTQTVSRFIAAGCLDRLHVIVAPIIIGAGPSSVGLPPIASMEHALRAKMHVHDLGGDVLLDCDLAAQRVVVGAAKKSR
jgi:diaminohydroxyphosphoribosylaminopyrimidine deaminase / 5-amino-6-(5-phosphoribosylamino)uracil reductase